MGPGSGGASSRRVGRRAAAGKGRADGPNMSDNRGSESIARFYPPLPPQRDGPRANDDIEADPVRLIDRTGRMLGVMALREARLHASEAGLDLVEVSPNAEPPVCKILDYGKFKYDGQKRAAEARKKQKTIEVKEIKMRPGIDDHDYGVKMRSIVKFLGEGDKVKVTMRFRGREMANQSRGVQVLNRVKVELDELGKVEQFPKLEGRQMTMVLAPR